MQVRSSDYYKIQASLKNIPKGCKKFQHTVWKKLLSKHKFKKVLLLCEIKAKTSTFLSSFTK